MRPTKDHAKRAGVEAVGAVRRSMAKSVAKLLERDPDRLATAVETGLVSRAWIEDPGGNEPFLAATPAEVVERFLEREVEQRPSVLSQLGLSAVQILSWRGEQGTDGGVLERLAVAFTDLVGFTAFTTERGDDAATAILAEHYRASGPIVRSRGGRIVKRLGDGLLLTFPSPEAAVLACLELAASPPAPLALRAGVHAGDVVCSRDDVIGHAVNVAARVTDDAGGGEVLVTRDVRDDIGDLPNVVFGREARRRYKGLGNENVYVSPASLAPR
jgi:adenylate cyclase